jgi:hypothetical protein
MSCIRTGGGSFFYEQSKVKLQDRATGSKKWKYIERQSSKNSQRLNIQSQPYKRIQTRTLNMRRQHRVITCKWS